MLATARRLAVRHSGGGEYGSRGGVVCCAIVVVRAFAHIFRVIADERVTTKKNRSL